MRNYGLSSLSEFLDDWVVFRNLEPMDTLLPGLKQLYSILGLPPGVIPRKNEDSYSQVMAQILGEAQRIRQVNRSIQRLLYIGDTQYLDGTAFANLCQAGSWSGMAFIASENNYPSKNKIVPHNNETLFMTNRWAAISDFGKYISINNFPVDETTAVVLDIDKTLLGARGRNGAVIDQARIQAVEETLASLLGTAFDRETFHSIYKQLNLPEFHPFTTDNQDYLAYLCLILGSGYCPVEGFLNELRSNQLGSFVEFISRVDAHKELLAADLAEIHAEIYLQVKAGDPTPFKRFRRTEYLTTIRRFGQLEDSALVEDLLTHEIVITQEIRVAALDWKNKGALLFGLSDKPDEAATPSRELASRGFQPIHRAVTHAVGESGFELENLAEK